MNHLAAAEAYVRLSEQANRLRQLQALLDTSLPAYLQPGTHVANFKRGKIIIHADSGAVAVKLRQMAPTLAETFIQQGQEVTGIEVRVQAKRPSRTTARKKFVKQLGAHQKQVLTSLSSGLTEDSPLKLAIDRLLRNTI
ncbi:hypothetical protein MASR1M60_06790 [Rhodocyclaceae bacterium]